MHAFVEIERGMNLKTIMLVFISQIIKWVQKRISII